jgi:hypothetical protein
MTRKKPGLWDRAQIAPRIAPPTYEEPPKCGTCNHRGELHEGWFSDRPKKCSSFEVGGRNKCQCKKYVRSA